MHRAKYYFTSNNTWYLITVPNMNKISPFFYEISQQIHKMYEKVAIITQIWQKAKCYFTSMSNALYLIAVTHIFFNHILWDNTTLKFYREKMAIITQFGTQPNSILRAAVAHGTMVACVMCWSCRNYGNWLSNVLTLAEK